MKNIIFVVFCICITACGPEDNPNGCSLDSVDGDSYVGMIRLCNALPGQQLDFPGKAKMEVNDSILTFLIQSSDPNINFVHNLSVIDECREPEPNIFIHVLRDSQNKEIIGQIGLEGTSISINLGVDPCPENGSFEGLIK